LLLLRKEIYLVRLWGQRKVADIFTYIYILALLIGRVNRHFYKKITKLRGNYSKRGENNRKKQTYARLYPTSIIDKMWIMGYYYLDFLYLRGVF